MEEEGVIGQKRKERRETAKEKENLERIENKKAKRKKLNETKKMERRKEEAMVKININYNRKKEENKIENIIESYYLEYQKGKFNVKDIERVIEKEHHKKNREQKEVKIELHIHDYAPKNIIKAYDMTKNTAKFKMVNANHNQPQTTITLATMLHQTKQVAIIPLTGENQMIAYTKDGKTLRTMIIPKFNLVLDLDETLVVTRECMKKEEKADITKNEYDILVEDELKQKRKCITRVRPGVHNMLKWAAPIFNILIVTNGTQNYAREIIKILDQEQSHILKYFTQRYNKPWFLNMEKLIVSREKLIQLKKDAKIRASKSLTRLGLSATETIILDDDPNVWCENSKLALLPFHYICGKNGFQFDYLQRRTMANQFAAAMRYYSIMKITGLQTLKCQFLAHYYSTMMRDAMISPSCRTLSNINNQQHPYLTSSSTTHHRCM